MSGGLLIKLLILITSRAVIWGAEREESPFSSTCYAL